MEVLHYNVATNFIHQEMPLVSQNANASPRKENARRRLNFGGPTQAPQTCAQEANGAFVQRLMSQMANEYCRKWEFDFEAGQPLPSSSTSRFQYNQIETNAMPSVYSPIIYSSPVHSDLENLSDSENCSLNATRLSNMTNSQNKSEESSFDESTEFVLPCQSPKKMLKKPSTSAYSTPKKTRVTHLTDYMSYRKRKSVTLVASKNQSPFKSIKTRHSERLSPYVLRRHSMAN